MWWSISPFRGIHFGIGGCLALPAMLLIPVIYVGWLLVWLIFGIFYGIGVLIRVGLIRIGWIDGQRFAKPPSDPP
jgi:hypothetical protein